MIKLLLFLLLGLTSVLSFAKTKLQTGDVILQPLKCWACTLIESQESSEFSHIGIVLEKDDSLFVAEAYGSVRLIALKEFLKKAHPRKKNKFIRLKSESLDQDELKFNIESFLGNPYDKGFRWNNYIEDREAIYCSELVYKVLAPVVKFNDLYPKRMLFDENPELWDRYFQGNTPRGELGISPEDFNKSQDFIEIEVEEL